MQLLTALRNAAQRVVADLQDSNLFSHSGDKGEFRERIIDQYLRPFLPHVYGLGSGLVFSVDGASSRQIDIVLYDAVFSNVLFREHKNNLFPCESIFGTIEVKSQLTTDELKTSIVNIESVKRLPRQASDMLDMLPYSRIGVGGGLTYNRERRNSYLGVIFAYDGLRMEAVADHLNSQMRDDLLLNDRLPDFVFCFERQYMVFRAKNVGTTVTPTRLGEPHQFYSSIPTGTDTLPLLYLTLNVCLNEIRLRGADLNQYWINVFDSVVRGAS